MGKRQEERQNTDRIKEVERQHEKQKAQQISGTDMQAISQDFSDCGLRNDKSKKKIGSLKLCKSCLFPQFYICSNLLQIT